MIHLVWDASALSKQFAPESGSETVDACLNMADSLAITTVWGYAETYSILLRKRNGGKLGERAFREAVSALNQIVVGSGFAILPVPDEFVLSCTSPMEAHNLNSTDAAILRALLEWRSSEASPGGACVLVTSDLRFLRAAQAEGLPTLNPEGMTPEAALVLLGSLSANP